MFYNTSYTDFMKAAEKPDGLTILGAFFEVRCFKMINAYILEIEPSTY